MGELQLFRSATLSPVVALKQDAHKARVTVDFRMHTAEATGDIVLDELSSTNACIMIVG